MIDMTYWCESCARKSNCYTIRSRPKCFVAITNIDRKTENSSEIPNNCETCRNKGFEGCEQPCLGCGCCGLYQPKDETQTGTQTETQNSNLTFEKDECAKEYEELGLKELKELINADRKTEPQTTDYCDVCNHKGCDNCIADGSNPYCVPSQFEPKDEPQTDCQWK